MLICNISLYFCIDSLYYCNESTLSKILSLCTFNLFMSLMIWGRRYISPTFCDDKKGEKKYKHKDEVMGEKKYKMK